MVVGVPTYMQRFIFQNVKAYNLFRALSTKADEPVRVKFAGAVNGLYRDKQMSPDDLETFKLTEEDIRAAWEALTNNLMQNGREKHQHD